MSVLEALAIVGVGPGGGDDQHHCRIGVAHHLPHPAGLRVLARRGERQQHLGLVPGSLSGAIAYRSELRGQRPRLVVLGRRPVPGGITGAVLLLALPGSVFRHVVPVLILVACVLVALQPRLSARLALPQDRGVHGGPMLFGSVFLTGVYGGYFGAAQGVILLSLLGIFLRDHLQKLNATKNVLAFLVNGVAGIVFVAFAHVSWEAAGLLAAGSVVGGQVGGVLGRRLPAPLLRGIIVVVGVIAAIALLV